VYQRGVLRKVKRGLTFDETVIVFTEIPDPIMHVDVEEGNACGIKNGDIVEIL